MKRKTAATFNIEEEVDGGRGAYFVVRPDQTVTVKVKHGPSYSLPLHVVARMVVHRCVKREKFEEGVMVPGVRRKR